MLTNCSRADASQVLGSAGSNEQTEEDTWHSQSLQ